MRSLIAFVFLVSFPIVTLLAEEPVAKPTPAEDLKTLQGNWQVQSIFWPNNQSRKLPPEIALNEKLQAVTIEGNRLVSDGKTVATLTNDLGEVSQQAELGWKMNRLVLLTLPDGKGLWCSYRIEDSRVQLTYPHTTSCHRGSGQIVYLERPEK